MFVTHLVVVGAVDGQTLAVPDLLPELGLGLAVGDAGHEAGGEAARGGDAPQPVILADRLLLQTLELHALITSETNIKTHSKAKMIRPEGDNSIERCPAVLYPAIWNDPVPVGSRQATVYLLEVSIITRIMIILTG